MTPYNKSWSWHNRRIYAVLSLTLKQWDTQIKIPQLISALYNKLFRDLWRSLNPLFLICEIFLPCSAKTSTVNIPGYRYGNALVFFQYIKRFVIMSFWSKGMLTRSAALSVGIWCNWVSCFTQKCKFRWTFLTIELWINQFYNHRPTVVARLKNFKHSWFYTEVCDANKTTWLPFLRLFLLCFF